jgi:phosphoglycerate dehydrogenase-like enzyme
MNTTGHPVEGFTTCYPIGDLNEIVKHMDIVVNVLPLTSTTHHLYDAAFFDAMQQTASFINVGRGPSVDTAALVQAMQHKKLAFAALDVFEEEPLPKNHPLWQTEHVLITPHFSGWTPNFQVKLMAIFLANLETFTKTGALAVNQVNLTKGY